MMADGSAEIGRRLSVLAADVWLAFVITGNGPCGIMLRSESPAMPHPN
jgi:hypothetical protein